MFSALDVDIRPGLGLGMFEIGSSLWTVLDLLRRMQHHFPQVDVKYDPDSPSTTPIILHVRPHLDLLFSGQHQRLHTICLRKLRDQFPPVTVRYKDVILSSSEETLRRLGVSRTFGPRYPGDDLRYPGVWFSFEEDTLGEGFKSTNAHPEDRMQEVKRIIISQKGLEREARDALDEVIECSAMFGEVLRAIVKIRQGVSLYFHPATTKPVHIRIGETTAQDLTLALGPPLRVHYKDDERMTIHSSDRATDHASEADYFYNYFQHGIDFLLSGRSHAIKKIILHSNIPGSPMFQRYKRCPWEIEGGTENNGVAQRMRFYDRFESSIHFLNPRQPSPRSMHFDRTDEEEYLALPAATSRLHGHVILTNTRCCCTTSPWFSVICEGADGNGDEWVCWNHLGIIHPTNSRVSWCGSSGSR